MAAIDRSGIYHCLAIRHGFALDAVTKKKLLVALPKHLIDEHGKLNGLFAPFVAKAVAENIPGTATASELLQTLKNEQLVTAIPAGELPLVFQLADVYQSMCRETERMIVLASKRTKAIRELQSASNRSAALETLNMGLSLVPQDNRVLFAETIKRLLNVSGVRAYTVNSDRSWKHQYQSAGEEGVSRFIERRQPAPNSEKGFINRLLFDLANPNLPENERKEIMAQVEKAGCQFFMDEDWGYFFIPRRENCDFVDREQLQRDVKGDAGQERNGFGESAKGEDFYLFLRNKTANKLEVYWFQNWRSNAPLFREMEKDLQTLHGLAVSWARASELSSAHHQLAEQNQALKELARTDGLTGLNNRRNFDLLLEEEFARSKRYNHPLSLLMIDLDHFKLVNDIYGHPAGDIVLKEVAGIITGNIRGTDKAARYGGEEFAVILPETNGGETENAVAIAQRIRQAIADLAIEIPGKEGSVTVKITVSVGVATYPKNVIEEAKDLVVRADEALYLAKNQGRNRVVRHWKS